ncbi:hypothetical protein [Nitriliruptor alkaliphilus]|uniref:hypothetical protein n=1 Tax=Nitriliruptor alkaliphilus TaxID=427918 RepID=UPI000695AE01|nr:hypothetical protein [Nitriliruptor alkaliphilus]
MIKQRAFLAAGVLISSVLVGCGSDDDARGGSDDQVEADVEATDADGQDQGDGAADDGAGADGLDNDGTDDDSDGDVVADRLGEVSIDQTQSHPNGVEVTVHSLRVEQDAIFVDIEAFNGAPFEVLLAALDLATVVDDTGREYRYEPPEDNEALEIEPNGTLEGSIAFIGRVGPDASSVTLRFNYSKQGEALQPADAQNADFADAPSFEFADLPLPGGDA